MDRWAKVHIRIKVEKMFLIQFSTNYFTAISISISDTDSYFEQHSFNEMYCCIPQKQNKNIPQKQYEFFGAEGIFKRLPIGLKCSTTD